jgi:hypothetical protein
VARKHKATPKAAKSKQGAADDAIREEARFLDRAARHDESHAQEGKMVTVDSRREFQRALT